MQSWQRRFVAPVSELTDCRTIVPTACITPQRPHGSGSTSCTHSAIKFALLLQPRMNIGMALVTQQDHVLSDIPAAVAQLNDVMPTFRQRTARPACSGHHERAALLPLFKVPT